MDPHELVPGTNTPKGTIVTLRSQGYQPWRIAEILPNVTLSQIEAVLKEAQG